MIILITYLIKLLLTDIDQPNILTSQAKTQNSDPYAGAPKVPIRNFEDVIHHGYRVVVGNKYYTNILATAKPGSGMRRVFESGSNFKEMESANAAIEEAKTVPNTLFFYGVNPKGRGKKGLTLKLYLDNYYTLQAALALQKDSEFLQEGNSMLGNLSTTISVQITFVAVTLLI